jgi:hypothetical protein
MREYLGKITQPSEKVYVLGVGVECSFLLKNVSTAWSCGGTRYLEMIANEVKGGGQKFTWEIILICKSPTVDI